MCLYLAFFRAVANYCRMIACVCVCLVKSNRTGSRESSIFFLLLYQRDPSAPESSPGPKAHIMEEFALIPNGFNT